MLHYVLIDCVVLDLTLCDLILHVAVLDYARFYFIMLYNNKL